MIASDSSLENIYHVVNKGIEKTLIFLDKKDIERFLETIKFYRFQNPSRFSFRKRPPYHNLNQGRKPLVEILAFCLMPDHFHMLLKEKKPGAASRFVSLVCNSYTKYYNNRNKRSGFLFAGTFKSKKIESGEQLAKVARHIHLDPYIKNIVMDPKKFPFSSLPEYLGKQDGFCEKSLILGSLQGRENYENFALDIEDYKRNLEQFEKLFLE